MAGRAGRISRVVTPKGKAVQLEGLNELQNRIADILDRTTGRSIKRIHMGAALVLRDEARDLAPVLKKPKKGRIPGLLKSAIFAAYGSDNYPWVWVGVNKKLAPHAKFIEFGTAERTVAKTGKSAGRVPPQPFMRPAIIATRAKVVAIIAEGYRKLLEAQ